MDIITIISCITSALGVGAFISGTINRRLAKQEAEAQEKEKARQEETVLLLKGIKATGALSYATAVALKRGHANGEVEAGVEEYKTWEKDIDDFLIKQSTRQH